MKVALVRGKFLNAYEMQSFEPLSGRFDMTAFGSSTSYHDSFSFPVVKLYSPMDLRSFPYKMQILNRLFIDAHYLFGLEKKLQGFDIVHSAETYYHYTQQALGAKKRGYVKKVIATVLENIPFNNEGIWGRKAFKARARIELDHIIALTQKTKDALQVEGTDPNKITVIGHGIDTRRFFSRHRARGNKRLRVLFVGRLEKEKGVYDFIAAAKRLHSDNVEFVMVGEGREKRNIPSWIKTYTVSYDHMPNVYRDADIFVAPSKPTSTWQEQYCTALLEAQASGLAIVTTQTGGIPENIGDAGIVVEPGNVKEIIVAIKSFIDEPKKRNLYEKLALKRALSVHDSHIIARKIARVYESLV